MTSSYGSKHNAQDSSSAYGGYAGLPPLVDLETMEGAQKKGLTVAGSVARLKRFHWALKRLHGIFVARIASTPIYELKMAFGLHAHYCAEHVGEFAKRVREMRQPPYDLEVCPDPSLDQFFDEILSAPNIEALVLGLYQQAIPALTAALSRMIADTHKLFDHPSYRICRLTLVEMEDVLQYGEQAIACLVSESECASLRAWLSSQARLLAAAGGLDGAEAPTGESIERMFSAVPYRYDGAPQRDARFKDPYNMGVNAEAMLFNPEFEPLPKSIMLYFKRMREIDVPEVMSSILAETSGKPWEYTRDMTRQMWDEARHAMMGEVGFVSLGIDWTTVPLNFTWSLGLNTQLTAKDRHAVLFTIEQGLMPKKNGKENEWEIAVATESALATLIQDYDWADEILHARIGRDWLVPELGSQMEALAYGDKAWSRILMDWSKWRADGFTQHRNWWPDVYRQACRHWGIEPDPFILAYNTTYENTRADLKQVAG